MKFHSFLRFLATYLFCTPLPDGWEFEQCKTTEKFLHVASTVLDFVDLINLVLDLQFAYTLIFNDDKFDMGIFMLVGMLLARLVARRGNFLMYRGGVQWAPFFQNTRQYYSRYSPERKTILKTLYCLTFTELSVFFFEDAVTILIWADTGSFDKTDAWELANGWMTFFSAFSAMVLLWISIAYSLNCAWCKNSVENIQGEQELSSKCCGGIKMIIAFVWKVLCGTIFVFFFLLCICIWFGFLIWMNITVMTDSLTLEIRGAGFYLLVGISWALSLYFVFKFWCNTNTAENDLGNTNTGSNNGPSPSRAGTKTLPQTNDTRIRLEGNENGTVTRPYTSENFPEQFRNEINGPGNSIAVAVYP